jgi:hypothetical protein
MNRKHLIWFPIVAVCHAQMASGVALLAFVLGLGIGAPNWVISLLFYPFWFPLMLIEKAGVNVHPFDGARSIIMNSLCWTAIMYPAWVLTRTVRSRVIAWCMGVLRPARKLTPPVVWWVAFAILGSMVGVASGYLLAVASTSARISSNQQDEEITIRLLEIDVHSESGPHGFAGPVMREWYRRVRRSCAAIGFVVGSFLAPAATWLIQCERKMNLTRQTPPPATAASHPRPA